MNKSSRLGSSMDSGSYLPRKSPRQKDDQVALLSGAVQRVDEKARTPGEEKVGAEDTTPTSTLFPPSDDGSPKNSFAREAGSKGHSVPPAPDVGLSPPALRSRTTESAVPPQPPPPTVPLEVADIVRFVGSSSSDGSGSNGEGSEMKVGGPSLKAGKLGVVTALESVDESPTGRTTCFFASGEVTLDAALLVEANTADPEPEPPKTFWTRAFGPAAVVETVAQLQEKQIRRLPYEVRRRPTS